jgi:tRNA threonylcarbamoyladenosine biosynthesis protein TsaE
MVTYSPAQTRDFGRRLGRVIGPGDVICLTGELGAGKTTLAAGIGAGWGALEVVTSPTFVFVNEYSRPGGDRLYHVDAYRLRNAADAETVALPDLLNDTRAALLIEWPERVLPLLPPERLWIELRLAWSSETVRKVRVEAAGERYERILTAIIEP